MAIVQFKINSKNQNGYLPFDGCRYRIVGEGGILLYPNDNNIAAITKADGLTKPIDIKDGVRFALEVYDLVGSTKGKPRFLSPFKGANNISQKKWYIAGKQTNPIISNIQQYYLQVQFRSSENNWKPAAQKYFYTYRMVERFRGIEKILCILKGFVGEDGKTDYISTESAETVNTNLIKISGQFDGISAINRLNVEGNEGVFIFVDLFAPDGSLINGSTPKQTDIFKAIKPIPFGSSTKKYREVNISASFNRTTENGYQKIHKLRENYRPILFDIREKKGETYKMLRKDGQEFLDSGKRKVKEISFNDGHTTQIYVPKNFKGNLKLINSKKAIVSDVSIGGLDAKKYSANEKPIDIAICKRPLDFESSGNFMHADYTPHVCMIEMKNNVTSGTYDEERLLSCTSKDFHSIIWSFKEFIHLNKLLAPSVYELISTRAFDTIYLPTGFEISTNLRKRIIEGVLKPIAYVSNTLGRAIYSDLNFVISKIAGKSVLSFPTGTGIRTYITTVSLAKTGRKYFRGMSIQDSKLKGSNNILFTIVIGLEVLEYISNPANDKQITDLCIAIISSTMKFVITIVIVNFLLPVVAYIVAYFFAGAGAAIGGTGGTAVVAGVLLGIGVGYVIQLADDTNGSTIWFQSRFRKLDSYEKKLLKEFTPIFNQYGIVIKV